MLCVFVVMFIYSFCIIFIMNKLLDSKRINDSAEELFNILWDRVRELSPQCEFDKLYLRAIFDCLSSKVEAEFLEEMFEYYMKDCKQK